MNKTPWVLAGPGENEVKCMRCNQRHVFQFPMAVYDFIAHLEAFATLHSECPEPEIETAMVPVPDRDPLGDDEDEPKKKRRKKKKGRSRK